MQRTRLSGAARAHKSDKGTYGGTRRALSAGGDQLRVGNIPLAAFHLQHCGKGMRLVLIVRIAGTPEDAPVVFSGESQRVFASNFEFCYLVADVVGKRCNRSHRILGLRGAAIDGARHLNRARGRLSGGKFLAFIIDQVGLIICLLYTSPSPRD